MDGSVAIAGQWLSDIKMEEYLTITELSSRFKRFWFPSNTRGFAKFIQLIPIAIFIGWAASRHKRK
jgi:hypothetical protein